MLSFKKSVLHGIFRTFQLKMLLIKWGTWHNSLEDIILASWHPGLLYTFPQTPLIHKALLKLK